MRTLMQLNEFHRSDKGDPAHTKFGKTYLDVMEPYFAPIRDTATSILEIGVKKGRSLRLWKEYFSKAKIEGIDFNPECISYAEDRIDILIASQNDAGIIEPWAKEIGPFDIIIDDGSHVNNLTIASYEILFKHLKPGGLYIIEDLANSYTDLRKCLGKWDGELERNLSLGHSINNTRAEMDRFFNDLVASMDSGKGFIESVQFWSMLCFIRKAQAAGI